MATLTIRNLSDDVKNRLRVRAARRGHSMEAEARDLLAAAVSEPEPQREPERISAAEPRGPIREAQAVAAPHKVDVAFVVDELIAERRVEAWQETLEALRRNRHQAQAMGKRGEDG